MSLPTVAAQWAHLRQRYQPSGDALYLSVVRQEHALQQVIPLLMSSILRVLLSGVSLILFVLLFVAHVRAARSCARIWSSIVSMSFCLRSTWSSSPAVLS